MARIPPEDTPIYTQLLQEQAAREAYAIMFADYSIKASTDD